MKPKALLDWPDAMEPFQPTSVAVTDDPDWERSTFQELETDWPLLQVQVRVQPLREFSPAVMYTSPCQPEPQSLTTTISAVQSPVPGSGSVVGSSGSVDRKSTRLNSSHVKISYAVF